MRRMSILFTLVIFSKSFSTPEGTTKFLNCLAEQRIATPLYFTDIIGQFGRRQNIPLIRFLVAASWLQHQLRPIAISGHVVDGKIIRMTDNAKAKAAEADIKPRVATDEVVTLLQKLYGLEGGSLKPLQGFDDLNYYTFPSTISNPFVTTLWPHGYVFKVMNSLDSKNDALCQGQNALMLFLRGQGVQCPVPVRTVQGRLYAKEKLPSAPVEGTREKEHIVRLLEFQPGVLLIDAPKSYCLFYEVGLFVAKLNGVLEKFSHPAYENHYSIWHLKSAPDIKSIIPIAGTDARKKLAETVLDRFTKVALTNAEAFQEVIIHGDLNENNIVVAKDDTGKWRVSAILDFGDSHRSCWLFEVAISLCYMMLECRRHALDPVVGAGHFLAGYLTIRPSFRPDCALLKLCICARLCQSLVLGLKAYILQPENKYVLGTQDLGWSLLEELWEHSDEHFAREWESVFRSYKIKSEMASP